MKNKVKFVPVLFAILLVFANATSSLAANHSEGNGDILAAAPSEIFISICDGFFRNVETASAINASGEDVTEQFYYAYLNTYNAGNYTVIRDACADLNEFAYVANEIVEKVPGSSKGIVTKTVQKLGYKLVHADALLQGKTFEYAYSLTGKFKYNDEEMIVTYAYTPSFSILSLNIGAAFDAYPVNVSLSKSIANGGSYVTFSVSYKMRAIMYNNSDWDIELNRATFGPYSDSVAGEPG